MLKWLLVGFMALAFPAVATAETFAIPSKNPVATVSFPDSWTVETLDTGVEAESKDGTLYIAIEAHELVDIKAAVMETIEYLQEHKVTVDPNSERKEDFKIGDLPATEFSWRGKDEDGPTNISLTVVGLPSEKLLLITYWATPEAEVKHQDALTKIVGSIQATRR
jgi:hypothetical protein